MSSYWRLLLFWGLLRRLRFRRLGILLQTSRVNALKADGQNVLAAANLYFVENPDETTVTQQTDDT